MGELVHNGPGWGGVNQLEKRGQNKGGAETVGG